MGRKAFIDPVSKVLKCHGYSTTNDPGDVVIDVDETFSCEPRKWRWDGSSWVNYVEPKTKYQEDADEARADAAISALKKMTPTEARSWVNANVNSLSDAKTLLGTMAAINCVLARKI